MPTAIGRNVELLLSPSRLILGRSAESETYFSSQPTLRCLTAFVRGAEPIRNLSPAPDGLDRSRKPPLLLIKVW